MTFKLKFDLFGGEGGAGDGAAAADAGAGEAAEPIKYQSSRRQNTGDLSNVLYGTEAPQAAAENQEPEVQVTSNTLEERKKAFRDMITGEYKDAYDEQMQRVINRRFAETKNLQKQVDDAKPILDKLAARYNVLDGDLSKLSKALDDDHTYWSSAAEEAGMSEDVYREVQQLRQQNAQILKMQQERQQQAEINERVQGWINQAEALKGKFPAFDLRAEMNDPKFMDLLRAGVPVEHAYKVIHMDSMMSDAVQATAQRTEKAVVNNIRAKGSRPSENGTASQSTFTVKRDVSKLSKADRAEIARRVARGEQISF